MQKHKNRSHSYSVDDDKEACPAKTSADVPYHNTCRNTLQLLLYYLS